MFQACFDLICFSTCIHGSLSNFDHRDCLNSTDLGLSTYIYVMWSTGHSKMFTVILTFYSLFSSVVFVLLTKVMEVNSLQICMLRGFIYPLSIILSLGIVGKPLRDCRCLLPSISMCPSHFLFNF